MLIGGDMRIDGTVFDMAGADGGTEETACVSEIGALARGESECRILVLFSLIFSRQTNQHRRAHGPACFVGGGGKSTGTTLVKKSAIRDQDTGWFCVHSRGRVLSALVFALHYSSNWGPRVKAVNCHFRRQDSGVMPDENI